MQSVILIRAINWQQLFVSGWVGGGGGDLGGHPLRRCKCKFRSVQYYRKSRYKLISARKYIKSSRPVAAGVIIH